MKEAAITTTTPFDRHVWRRRTRRRWTTTNNSMLLRLAPFLKTVWIVAGLCVWGVDFGSCFSPRPFARSFFHQIHPTSRTVLRDAQESMVSNATTASPSSSSATTNDPNLEFNATGPPIQIIKAESAPLKMPPKVTNDNNDNKKSKFYIDPKDLERLQESIDMVSLVECYNIPQFTRSGDDRASCLCPFHDDHNPSLKIDGNKGIFKCFSCGAGGNALRFVREYAKVHGTELSFLEAVKLLDDMVTTSSSSSSFRNSNKPILPASLTIPMGARPPAKYGQGNTTQSSPNIHKRKTKATASSSVSTVGTTPRDRVLLANLHAAAYFEDCLLTRVEAGSARGHIRNRGVNANTVKDFRMGFAPESYFTGQQQNINKPWGDGSLVHFLRDKGFSPQEIVDAGLAIRTKRGKQQLEQIEQKSGNNKTQAVAIVENDYTTLMDRFRGRLVVPIFDEKGKFVLGFGGRILESAISGSDFKAAKYLNSPESVVFQKKTVLFGQHMAEKTTPASKRMVKTKQKPKVAQSLIVVEGYMDAIAMWQAGIRETVASMGTALSLEQLLSAANTARKMGGRVVLCLDNDDAGVAAVERLCAGKIPILYSATQNSNVEFHVAQLPIEVKDPAEFLENHRDEEHLDRKFRNEVIKTAVPWTDWYTDRLLSSFNTSATNGEEGSFNAIFDRLSSFLSVFEDSEQRTRNASGMSPKLACLLDIENDDEENRVDVGAKCAQLESDLLYKASSILHSNLLRTQRTVEIYDDSAQSERSRRLEFDVSKSLEMSQDVTTLEGPIPKRTTKTGANEAHTSPEFVLTDDAPRSKRSYKKKRLRMKRRGSTELTPKAMTPHVRGVQASRFDDEWLGATANTRFFEQNHLRYDITSEGSRISATNKVGPPSSVRWNHNEFHGKWKTEQAASAGYSAGTMPPKNLDFLDKGTSSLVIVDEEQVTTFAEDMILRFLVRFPEARKSLSETMQVSQASGSNDEICWSKPDKQWLFNCLLEDQERLPQDFKGSEHLEAVRLHLLARPDLFRGALNEPMKQNAGVTEMSLPAEYPESSVAECLPMDRSMAVDAAVHDKSSDTKMTMEIESEMSTPDVKSKSSQQGVPNIGDDWLDFAQLDGDIHDETSASHGTVTDNYLDSIPDSAVDETDKPQDADVLSPTLNETPSNPDIEPKANNNVPDKDEAGVIDTEIVSYESVTVAEGSLEYLFLKEDEKLETFFHINNGNHDGGRGGDHSTRTTWAVQDLYTILQTSSVMQRIQAGRQYLKEQHGDSQLRGNANDSKQIVGSTNNSNDNAISQETVKHPEALAEYCSPDCPQGGLRHDLHRVQTLLKSNQRAMKRIYSLILADFSDNTANTRGYNWLINVLQFNDMKMAQWSDIIESKEGFLRSDEAIEELEDNLLLDWNELSNTDEMWDWNKNVETNHVSHIAERLETTQHIFESPDEVFDRMEEEWGWTEGADGNNNDDYSDSMGEPHIARTYEDDGNIDDRNNAIGEIEELHEDDREVLTVEDHGDYDHDYHDDDIEVEEEVFE